MVAYDQSFDPTTASAEALLLEHEVIYDGQPGEASAPYCKCGNADPDELAEHILAASRSIVYRESAAVLQHESRTAPDEETVGLNTGFQIMLARAEAAELSGPSTSSASV